MESISINILNFHCNYAIRKNSPKCQVFEFYREILSSNFPKSNMIKRNKNSKSSLSLFAVKLTFNLRNMQITQKKDEKNSPKKHLILP